MLKLLSFFCILLLAAPVHAKAGGPRLTLLFSANSEGEARACPT